MSMEETECKNGEASPLQKLYKYYSSPISLEKDERKSGAYAWIFFLGLVAAYDVYAIKTKKVETLTRAFWRGTEKPLQKVIPITVWTGLTAHLLLEKSIRIKKFGETKTS